jgi:hypothetical protein
VETVKEVAVRLGTDTAVSWADHRIEALEAEIRSNLQSLRALSDCVLNRDPFAIHLAQAVREVLILKQAR